MTVARLFPVPPPTVNDLTTQQRAQLLRKAKKIEQLLGATPHLLEISATQSSEPIHITLPCRRASYDGRRSSFESTVTKSSVGSITRSSSSTSYSRRKLVSQRSSSRSTTNSYNDEKFPILQLAMDSLTLDPPSNRSSFADSTSSPDSSLKNSPTCETASRISYRASRDSLVLETKFIIPTQNSYRKQKMDRLRKKLGADVPIDLVFPEDSSAEETPPTTSNTFAAPNIDKPRPPLPPLPAARARKLAGPRIAHTRDSIVDAASIHRARRQVHVHTSASATSWPPSVSVRHQKSFTTSIAPTDFRRVKHRLSFIVENPDENKAGFLNEYGLQVTRVSSDDNSDMLSEWFGANIELWAGRKGYEDTKSTANVPQRKRRPSSYRKPPPPLPVDLIA